MRLRRARAYGPGNALVSMGVTATMAKGKLQMQRHIQTALSERDSRVACLIVEG
jgi:hypothetical protein